ncbi:hydrolase YhcX [Marinicauda pacifica]|jgi:predicted amidohydrolase/GNAT superfamily N-acetyltransferase|uniref:GNAT family N-acetyltransferase n=1 Tax=Marinicauda pacifica TaxID=1133559 RepID=A0A4S2HAD9_9PROT|nr:MULTISPECIES: bifunctional GNAT family N-acetyltransferase/carbon-nitrogen hydrolase family protein [Marinicauda]TGY92887.1 GNAT family N-acetyltransferase [Marinicauda pacifica]GGE41112.1 hydrolase YhcX [Marinicauda pacifica]
MTDHRRSATLTVRNATVEDVPAILELQDRAYPDMPPDLPGQIRGQIQAFPDGQFVVEYEGDVVGWCATFIIDEATAFAPHTYAEITGNGYAARHDDDGDWLYGMEVAVDPSRRRLRIGQRLYNARKSLCQEWGLKGVVFGGRMPGLKRRRKSYPNPEDYLAAVQAREVKDPVANFQLRMGFEPAGILKAYYPDDKDSLGNAALMVWRNPKYVEVSNNGRRPDPQTVRVAAVQFQARAVDSVREFERNVEYFVDVCSDYKADFCVFPEMFTVALLSLEKKKLTPQESIEALTRHTPRFLEFMSKLAVRYNINIVGGSHPTKTDDGDIQNVAYIFLRDGSIHSQEKIHPTPNEKYWWNIKGGDFVHAIPTDCGPVGVLICYDMEFPELARRMADEGARIIFCPYATDDRTSHLRVRYCSHARAIENQVFVVTAGNVGNLPDVENMDINYAESAVITPCDFPFARDGLAAVASESVETVAVADLRVDDLTEARRSGTVRNLRDRRFDLYRIVWSEPSDR